MTVEEIPPHFELLQDSQDIDSALEIIGKQEYRHEAGCLFVSINEGDYDEVFYCESSVPYNWKPVYKLQ